MRPQLNAIDRLVAWAWPQHGVRRLAARVQLAHYEAARPNKQRKFRQDGGSPNTLVSKGAIALRNQVRYLERNHDLVRGALNTLVVNTVGPQGIGVEFQPRRMDGAIHTEYAGLLAAAWRDWCRRPEVTHRHTWAKTQRLLARTWLRDGEGLAQRLIGPVPFLDHGTVVPYSLELMEPDLLPMDYDEGDRIRQGIERNAWGRPVAYHLYREHPGEIHRFIRSSDLKRVPADRMLHLALLERIGQLRGVSDFATVIARLEDIKDYEESERIAAKVAAMLTAYVKRQAPSEEGYIGPATDEAGNAIPRDIALQPGMVIDTLVAGEEIGLIDSKRPNPNLVTFRQGQLRAVAAGISASYSSISRDYGGTYSSQRQELVEQWIHYAALTDEFVGMAVQPVVEDFIAAAHLSGVAVMPRDLKPGTHDDVLFVAPSMPWIDPLKEAMANLALAQAGFASEVEIIRRRGGNPDTVLEQIAEWRRRADEKKLRFNSNVAHQATGGTGTAGTQAGDAGEAKDDSTGEED